MVGMDKHGMTLGRDTGQSIFIVATRIVNVMGGEYGVLSVVRLSVVRVYVWERERGERRGITHIILINRGRTLCSLAFIVNGFPILFSFEVLCLNMLTCCVHLGTDWGRVFVICIQPTWMMVVAAWFQISCMLRGRLADSLCRFPASSQWVLHTRQRFDHHLPELFEGMQDIGY